MAENMERVAQIFRHWGVRVEIVPALGGQPETLNVFTDPGDRYPGATVFAPKDDDGWVWGDHYEFGVRADVEPAVVATAIRRTLSGQRHEALDPRQVQTIRSGDTGGGTGGSHRQ